MAYNRLIRNRPVEGLALTAVIEGRLRSLVISRDKSADFRRLPGIFEAKNPASKPLIFIWRFGDQMAGDRRLTFPLQRVIRR